MKAVASNLRSLFSSSFLSTRVAARLRGVSLFLVALLGLAVSMRAQSTYFLDDTRYFSKTNDKAYQNFSITGGNISYELRFVSDYNAICAIISNGSLQSFLNGASVPTYTLFNHQFGYHPITLGPGNYSVVVRNDVNAANTSRYELDRVIDFSSDSNFYDNYFSQVYSVKPNGGYCYQGFSTQSGYRYWIDGASTGMKVYIIPASQFSNFTSGGTFNFYPDYSSDSPGVDLPGGYEVKLAAGSYYLVARNPAAIAKPIQFNCSRWKVRANSSGGTVGIDLSGSVSYQPSGNNINLAAGKVANNNTSGTSGTLRLQLFASKSRYTGESISGYLLGTRSLGTLKAHYYLSNITGYVPYTRPPSGSYYMCMLLQEYTSSGWTTRDFTNFTSLGKF